MPKVDRRLFREQMKKEFKKFVKGNKAYKQMTLQQFIELVKLNMVKIKKQALAQPVLGAAVEPHAHDHSHEHSHDDEIQDMFTSVVEESNEAPITE